MEKLYIHIEKNITKINKEKKGQQQQLLVYKSILQYNNHT